MGRPPGRRFAVVLCAALAGCDAPAGLCDDEVRDVGALCYPDAAVVQVGYGFAPEAIVAVDVDGDGVADVAAASPSRQMLTVAWGPAYAEATSWSLGEAIAGVAVGDVDGDGRRDVATALPESDQVVVVFGRGGRTFTRPRRHAAGDTPRAVIAADLDADGVAELITANVGDGSVGVVRGGVALPSVVVGSGPHALAAGDVDGDGANDVAVALADDDAVQVLRGDGAGGLQVAARHVVGAAPMAVVVADLDGDGNQDVATADALDDTVTVIVGDGAGGSTATRTWPTLRQPEGLVVVAGEVPALGVLSGATAEVVRLDPRTGVGAVTATFTSATAVADGGDGGLIYAGNGATVRVTAGAQGLVFSPWWQRVAADVLATVDLDGDGADELVVRDRATGAYLVLRGSDGGAIGEPLPIPVDTPVLAVLAADIDGDARPDLVVVRYSGSDSDVSTLLQQGDGSFAAAPGLSLGVGVSGDMLAGDFDGSGTRDLMAMKFRAEDGRRVLVWIPGHGAQGWGASAELAFAERVAAVATAQLGGDVADDLVFTVDDEPVLVVAIDPVLGGASTRIFLPEGNWYDVAIGELDGAAELDAMVCGSGGLQLVRRVESAAIARAEPVAEWPCFGLELRDVDDDGDLDAVSQGFGWAVLVNDGAGGFTPGSHQTGPAGSHHFRMADLDGDRIPDLVGGNLGALAPLHGGFGPVLREQARVDLGGGGSGVFADFDGDGRVDRAQTGRGLAVALADGAGFGAWRHVALAAVVDEDVTAVHAAAAADLDGDGADELVLLGHIEHDPPLRSLSVVRAGPDGAIDATPVTRLASGATTIVVRDVDGDEHPDIVLFAAGSDGGTVALLRGQGDGGFAAVTTRTLSIAGRVRGLFDMNGDRRLDVLLETDGALHVARGQDGGGFADVQPWGDVQPLNVLGSGPIDVHDVDGDRTSDVLAVGSGGLKLYPGGPDGRSSGRPRLIDGYATIGLSADLDGDGTPEIVGLRDFAGDYPDALVFGRATGTGGFALEGQPVPGLGALGQVFGMHVLSVDEDPRPDIVLVQVYGFTIVGQRP